MKKGILLSLLLASFGCVQARETAVAQKIIGIVVEAANVKTPVEFASVALEDKTTKKIVNGATTDAKGAFEIQNVVAGNYKIIVSFVGFSDKTIENVVVTKGNDLNVGTIQLASNSKTLNEVTVSSTKSLIEEKVDRTIYNADKDISSKGGDASDVLRKVPMLTVDLEGNVSIRGSSNIKVLINNKPSTIMASSVADALKQIPADMIQTVEVITSPSSKYDAEGSTGIINIITKKNNLEGYFLSVDLGVGNRASMLGLQGSVRKGKFGATLGGHGRAMYNKSTITSDQTTTINLIEKLTKQVAEAKDNPLHGRYNIGFDYDIDKKQSLSGGVRFGIRNFARTQNQSTELFKNSLFESKQNRAIDTKELSNSVDLNVDYIHIYKPQQELSISTQYSRNNLSNYIVRSNLDLAGLIQNKAKNDNLNLNQETTFQLDYQTPIGANQILELGGKGIFRQVNSDYTYFTAQNATAAYVNDPTLRAGSLDYTQKIGAAYTAYTFSTPKKYNFKTGLRYEYTDINATDDKNINFGIAPYGILVPSLNISKSLKEGTTVKIGYSRRIQRPGLQQLNPNTNTANVQSISIGNPKLSPEFTNNVELGLSTRFKQTFINIAFFGNETSDAISQLRTADSFGVITAKFENIGKQRNAGFNFFGNVYLTPKWTVNGGFDVTYNYLEGQILEGNVSKTVSNDGFSGGGRLMTNMTLKNGWTVQGFGGMFGARVQLQGRMGGMMMYSLGMKKDFKNKKGSFGISGENFLTNATGIMRSELKSTTLTQTSVTNVYNRGIRLNLTYKFGKMGFEPPKKTRSVKNDDIKDGGGEGGGEGGGAPQGGQGRPNGGGMPPQGGQGKPNGAGKSQPNKSNSVEKPQQDAKPLPKETPKKE
jgi:outer membrane receptor protein involved in Fe transport